MNMIKYIFLRILALILQITGAVAVITVITSVISYDPSIFFAIGGETEEQEGIGTGSGVTPEEIAQFKEEIGINKSPVERFFEYMSDMLFRGDLGNSWFGNNQPVTEIYTDALATTLRVFGLGMLLFTIFAVILGILAARRLDGPLDKNIRLTTSFFYSFPSYVLGTIVIFLTQGLYVDKMSLQLDSFLTEFLGINTNSQPFNQILDRFMDSFANALIYKLLPVVIVVLIYTGFQFRLVRIYMTEVLNQNYIRTAHAKGLAESTILIKHGLRNALPELITSIATTFPVAFSGIVVLEKVFGIAGSGLVLINAGLLFNWPVLIGGAVIFTGLNATILAITDMIVNYIDPQLRYQ